MNRIWAMENLAFESYLQQEGKQALQSPQKESSFNLTSTFGEAFGGNSLKEGIAIIPIEGTILRKKSMFSLSTGLDSLHLSLEIALKDPTVKGILLDISSPGGIASGVQEFAESIIEAKKIKPCMAFVSSIAVSAAYWIASATGNIYVTPTSEVGSIGVLFRHANMAKLNTDFGIAYTYICAGEYKSVGNPDSPLSDFDKTVLQMEVNGIYRIFTSDVAKNMRLDLALKDTWANGRIFLGNEAKELGLVTHLVRTRKEAIRDFINNNKEFKMEKGNTGRLDITKDEIKAQYPDLVAQIQNEVLMTASAEFEKSAQEQKPEKVMALISAVLGEEAREKLAKVLETNISAEQYLAVASTLKAHEPQSNEDDTKSKILAGLMKGSQAVLATGQRVSDSEDERIRRIADIK